MRAKRGQAKKLLELALARTYWPDDCVIWPYGKSSGYGVVGYEGNNGKVANFICEKFHGPRPSGGVSAHGPCNEPACFNPRLAPSAVMLGYISAWAIARWVVH